MAKTSQLCIFNCLNGSHINVVDSPFIVGSGATCGWTLPVPHLPAEIFATHHKKGVWHILPARGIPLIFDGEETTGERAVTQGDHTLVVQGQVFGICITDTPETWVRGINHRQWQVHDQYTQTTHGPLEWPEMLKLMQAPGAAPERSIAHCHGLEMGFYMQHLLQNISPPNHTPSALHAPATAALAQTPPPLPGAVSSGAAPLQSAPLLSAPAPATRPANLIAPPTVAAAASAPAPRPAIQPAAEVNSEHGEFTCPICWLRFDRGDVMNISVHGSLRGDPVLGETAMQRFYATSFNNRGQALDAMNLAAPEQACPHCRRKLPPGFLDSNHYIFSIVGAPSSGKSYYLSVLVKMLQQRLFQNFRIIFRDGDPSENVILTQMKSQLFSAGTPQDAFLAKTDLEGALYESLPRQGRTVRLPKPFTFKLSSIDDPAQEASVVFYDNAGEHFEPSRNSADSPGAQHIAVASGIFFLFDPLHSADFRALLRGSPDPQLKGHRLDQQDVILAETEIRIKTLLGMESRERVQTPFAVLLGKCDTWLHLLGEEELLPAIVEGCLHLPNILQNSGRLRQLLLHVNPSLVTNAEAISENVMYFAISPLGSSPVEFIDSLDGSTRIGPDPQLLNPMYVEVPTLWVLSQLLPHMVPSIYEA